MTFLLTILLDIEDILIKCLRCGPDWILGSAHLVTRLLINGTVCQFVVLTPSVLTVLKVYVSRMEPKTLKLCMSVEIVALYYISHAISIFDVGSSGESGEEYDVVLMKRNYVSQIKVP